MNLPSPCSSKWSLMTATDSKTKHCSACNTPVHDFTHRTQAEFDLISQQSNGHLCGRFFQDAKGEIEFRKEHRTHRVQKIFLLALLFHFHHTLFSHCDMNAIEHWKAKLESRFQNNQEQVTFYGIAKEGRRRMDSVDVKITINNNFVILTTTDRRGRFTFELSPTLQLDTLVIKTGSRKEKFIPINESALLASKRVYRIKHGYRQTFVGCPSF